ncbi:MULTISPECIES: formimidoylglutamase [Flavobacteriaceae]|uniref:Arginase n=2 Tax=Flavobacteriaceae TaxID=49546 RepID=A0A4Y8AQK1_9FLAO|nr:MULTISPECIES: formimidoylglutamase [Flavobacteriaceae]TEW73032.1 arginase [Gramella jeungdoensis]GGK47604.1 arginase [Lutibacter litoralis]
MNFDYLKPVDNTLVAYASMQNDSSFGQCIKIYANKDNFPDLTTTKIAIIGVLEGRGAVDNNGTGTNLSELRKELYKLYPGNWPINVADLGDIQQGNTIEDTYFAVNTLVSYLIKNKIIPIIIGGGQELTYANYRAYDTLEQTVNIVAVDSKFDLGSIEDDLNSQSYLSKVVMNPPNNLFNFCNIGYQTYFNSQEEIDLLESLYFDAVRLGEVLNEIQIVEPILRDADIVSIDMSSIKNADAPGNKNACPNGLSGVDICAIARYAGISDKVSSFGIYEYNPILDTKNQTAQLISQMIWYFIEGVNFRANDYPFGLKDQYKKFIVPIEDEVLNFYKSHKSGRWWMEIEISNNNKFKRHALIPCTYQDYISASNQEIPERWMQTFKKLN